MRGLLARRWMLVVVLLAAVGAAGLWFWWPKSAAAPPRARLYRDIDVCLLTGDGGIGRAPASLAWMGMQGASSVTAARVSFLPVVGEQTVANAVPYLSSLIARRCAVIVAVGQAPLGAVDAIAARYPGTRFVVVGDAKAASNVTVIDATGDVSGRVRAAVVAALPPSPRR